MQPKTERTSIIAEHIDAHGEFGFEPAVSDSSFSSRASISTATPVVTRSRQRSPAGLGRSPASRCCWRALLTVSGGCALLSPASGAAEIASSNQDVEKGCQLFDVSCITRATGSNLPRVSTTAGSDA